MVHVLIMVAYIPPTTNALILVVLRADRLDNQ